MKTTTKFTVERDGREVTLLVEADYYPGSPGRTYGPPENCYPPEGSELVVSKLTLNGQVWDDALTDEEEDDIVNTMLMEADAAEEESPEYDYDDPPHEDFCSYEDYCDYE